MSDGAGADQRRVWYKAAGPGELAEGRVKSVTCGVKTVCLTRFEGAYAALDNRCPHQGGPLGEGSIEKGYLRCPWHGWDFYPTTGRPPCADRRWRESSTSTASVTKGRRRSPARPTGHWRVWQTSLHNPSFAAYAEICGALGIRVTQEEELDDALARALAHDGPSLVEIVSDPDLV